MTEPNSTTPAQTLNSSPTRVGEPIPRDDIDFGPTLRGLRPRLPVFDGRFLLERELGRGGMGVVWLATDRQLDRKVALKFLPEAIATDDLALIDLKRETKRCLDLTHPNIVRVNDWLERDGLAGIAMEFIDGPSLSRLRVERPGHVFSAAEIRPWLEAACAALHYAHESGRVVHRDLKPSNLMLTSAGVLKLCDFGIARSLGESRSRLTGGRQSDSAGTPPYMSPQHRMGTRPSPADDIYSLGATLYELFTGKPPFYTGNIDAQIESVVPPPMKDRREELGVTEAEAIPAAWEALVAACLDKDPAKRPPGAAAMLEWLDQPDRGRLKSSKSPGSKAATSRSRKIALAGVLAVALGGGYWWANRPPAQVLPAPDVATATVVAPVAPSAMPDSAPVLPVAVSPAGPTMESAKIAEAESAVSKMLADRQWTGAAEAIGKLAALQEDHPGLDGFRQRLKDGQDKEQKAIAALASVQSALKDGNLDMATAAVVLAETYLPGDARVIGARVEIGHTRQEMEKQRREQFDTKLATARSALRTSDLAAAEAALKEAEAFDANGAGLAEARSALANAKAIQTARPSDLPARGYFDLPALFEGTEYAGFKAYGQSQILKLAQQELKTSGHYRGTVDGEAGETTQQAILAWQRGQVGSPSEVTGRFDTPTLAALKLRGKPEAKKPETTTTKANPRGENASPKPRSGSSVDEFRDKTRMLEDL